MRGQAGFWDVDERYGRLSEAGDPLEKLNTVVLWGMFGKPLAKALKRSDGAKGGHPSYDPVMMFKILVLQALYGLSDDQAEFQIQDRFPLLFADFRLWQCDFDLKTTARKLSRKTAAERADGCTCQATAESFL